MNQGQFTVQKNEETQTIAKLRIHIKSQIRHSHFYGVITLCMVWSINEIWTVANMIDEYKRLKMWSQDPVELVAQDYVLSSLSNICPFFVATWGIYYFIVIYCVSGFSRELEPMTVYKFYSIQIFAISKSKWRISLSRLF